MVGGQLRLSSHILKEAMIQKCENMSLAERLFSGWQETMIWSCPQGAMGAVYASGDASVLAALGDFCFFAGAPEEALARFCPPECSGGIRILVPRDTGWSEVIESAYGSRGVKGTRYAFRKTCRGFDLRRLEAFARTLPQGVSLRELNREWYEECRKDGWCRDFVSLFGSYERFTQMGLGILAVKDGEILSGASSYSAYHGGIEIEVDTREDRRRQGLARACAAKLILLCLERGLMPSWDAANPASAALAEQLGFQRAGEYSVYFVEEADDGVSCSGGAGAGDIAF